MTILVRILSGLVHEIVAAPTGLALAKILPADDLASLVQAPDDVQEGWTYDGTTFSAPPTPQAVVTVPTSVSSAQAKIQCLRSPAVAGGKTLLDDITAAVQSAGGEAQIWFAEARMWERTNPYVASLSSSLKLTSVQVDALFIAAAQIAA